MESTIKINNKLCKTVVFCNELNRVDDVTKAGITILLKRMYTPG